MNDDRLQAVCTTLSAHLSTYPGGDFRNTESAKYLFIVAIATAIDLCNHIVAQQGGRAPLDMFHQQILSWLETQTNDETKV
jgi:uncharacterized protein YutE (UPF0331/DUF86 family)